MSGVRKNVILIVLLLALFEVMGATAAGAQSSLRKKVDSIFVIASSGEIRYRDLVEPAIDSLAAMGAQIAPQLIDKFTTKSARERLTIINILKKIGSPALEHLIPALSRSDDLIVQRVCWALGDIGDSAALPGLVGVVDHKSWQVREKAVDALGKLDDNRADEAVIAAISDSVGQVRKAAAVAAGRLRVNHAIPHLVARLGDEFYGARMSAMEALTELDTVEVILTISDSMTATNPMTGNIGCRVLGKLATDQARDVLLKQVEFGDTGRRTHAAVAIVESDPEDHCGFHRQLLYSETDRLARLRIESAIYTAQHGSSE